MRYPTTSSISTPYASFDIFDTLIVRASGSPRSVFSCVEKRAVAEGLDVAGFSKKRVEAESRAIKSVGPASMTLADIYSELLTDYDSGLAEQLKKMEVQAEIDLCLPVTTMVEFYNNCLHQCKKVFLVSDMYLPSDVIERMLVKCGIKGYASLYVSCDFGETKSDGKLFKTLSRDNGISLTEITHVGDSVQGDYHVPIRLGMKSILVHGGHLSQEWGNIFTRISNKTGIQKSGELDTLKLAAGDDMAARIGYCILGPLLVDFCNWVHANYIQGKPGTLHFIARDGWNMKRCYNLLYPNDRTSYFLASRRSITVPMLWKNPGIEGFIRTAGLGREMSVGEILMRLGLDSNRAHSLELKYDLNDEMRLTQAELKNDDRFVSLFSEAEDELLENSHAEFSAMKKYMLDAFSDDQTIYLVDLGWRGSIQHAIETALPDIGLGKKNVEGLYLGVDPHSRWASAQNMHGYLFAKEQDEESGIQEQWFNAVVEAFFSAPHGTAVKYVKGDDCESHVVLAPREDGNEESSPLFAMQDSALRFARDYTADNWDVYNLFNKSLAVRELYRLGLRPTREEAEYLGDIVFSYQEATPLARPSKTAWWYARHPIKLATEMNVCYWKPAFLTRLAGAAIPWWKILSFVKRIAGYGWK